MLKVYGKTVKGYVRPRTMLCIGLGCQLVILSLIFIAILILHTGDSRQPILTASFILFSGTAGVALTVFGITAAKRESRNIPMVNIQDRASDISDFYFCSCPRCGTDFLYEKKDRLFRFWALRGIIQCPCCDKPIRHKNNHKGGKCE